MLGVKYLYKLLKAKKTAQFRPVTASGVRSKCGLWVVGCGLWGGMGGAKPSGGTFAHGKDTLKIDSISFVIPVLLT